MKFSYIIVMLFVFSSCIKEKTTYSTTTFINSTFHTIQVTPWFNGSINAMGSFSLAPNESKVVDNSSNRGLGIGVSYGVYSSPNDSIQATFDGNTTIVHYRPTFVGLNPKRYLYFSKRNIYNDSSYTTQLLKDEKYTRDWSFKYTFTEQDYLDAKR